MDKADAADDILESVGIIPHRVEGGSIVLLYVDDVAGGFTRAAWHDDQEQVVAMRVRVVAPSFNDLGDTTVRREGFNMIEPRMQDYLGQIGQARPGRVDRRSSPTEHATEKDKKAHG